MTEIIAATAITLVIVLALGWAVWDEAESRKRLDEYNAQIWTKSRPCRASGCESMSELGRPFCPHHWNMLPKDVQGRETSWRRWKEIHPGMFAPNLECKMIQFKAWRRAVDDGVKHIQSQEAA